MIDFRLYFPGRARWVDVYLHDVTPETFERRGGGRWACYEPYAERGKVGLFGSLYFVRSRVRVDTVAHELIHVLTDWLTDRGATLTARNEERVAEFFDGLTRQFWREMRKLGL